MATYNKKNKKFVKGWLPDIYLGHAKHGVKEQSTLLQAINRKNSAYYSINIKQCNNILRYSVYNQYSNILQKIGTNLLELMITEIKQSTNKAGSNKGVVPGNHPFVSLWQILIMVIMVSQTILQRHIDEQQLVAIYLDLLVRLSRPLK